jgi:HPr kinase/phosphorylase
VGKSETALELVKRGHRFVADDVVEIRKLSDETLIGRSPDIIRHMMEIRGLGIIDVSLLYGMGAVMQDKDINLAIHLELGNVINIDRLGTEDNHITLLGVKIPQIIVPVRPGRNLAIIIEVAAMNFRLKSLGQMGTDKLDQNLLKILQGG